MPDVMLLHPTTPTIFVEVKKLGGRASPVQRFRHEELRQKGFDVRVIDPSHWPLDKAEWQCGVLR
jgi:hypothetical protein